MGIGGGYKGFLDRRLEEERHRRRAREKSADGLLRQKSSENRENRPALTGYKPLKEEEPLFKETMRMENSRGTLAMGGDEGKRPALVVTEKRRPGEGAVAERERVLQEKGKREYFAGQNRIFSNSGERETGAVGFQFGTGFTRGQIMEGMRQFMDGREQRTLERMTPFIVTEKELEYKQRLEEALQEARRQEQGPVQEDTVKMLDGLLAEKKEELIRKRQKEASFGRKLEAAVQEEKKTVWEISSDWRTVKHAGKDSDSLSEEEGTSSEALSEEEGVFSDSLAEERGVFPETLVEEEEEASS